MNKSYVVLFLMCAAGISHASEPKAVVPALPSWKDFHQKLRNDYKQYLTNRLEEYNKTDVAMDELLSMGKVITGGDCPHKLFRTRDVNGNGYLHIAVQKEDLQTVQWIYNNCTELSLMFCNKKHENPLDLCIQKLFSSSKTYDNSYQLLCATIKYIKSSDNDFFKKSCLIKVLTAKLQLEQKNCNLALPAEIIDCLIPSGDVKRRQLFLSNIYKAISDPDSGDTFTHLFVREQSADEIYALIKQERVSFEKNKEGKTPLDIALERFRKFTQNIALINSNTISFRERKCCLFMLLNYCKVKSGRTADTSFGDCCEKHKIS